MWPFKEKDKDIDEISFLDGAIAGLEKSKPKPLELGVDVSLENKLYVNIHFAYKGRRAIIGANNTFINCLFGYGSEIGRDSVLVNCEFKRGVSVSSGSSIIGSLNAGDSNCFDYGSSFVGRVTFGNQCRFGDNTVFRSHGLFGDYTEFGDNTKCFASSSYGQNTSFGEGSIIMWPSVIGTSPQFGKNCAVLGIEKGKMPKLFPPKEFLQEYSSQGYRV